MTTTDLIHLALGVLLLLIVAKVAGHIRRLGVGANATAYAFFAVGIVICLIPGAASLAGTALQTTWDTLIWIAMTALRRAS